MNFAERIVFCRKKAMLSQEELANRLGVSRQAVSKWETGESIPDMSNLAALAEIFDVSLDWLIRGEETEPPRHSEPEKTGGKQPLEERLPKFIGNMIKRYGWLAGLYLAFGGGMFFLVGLIANISVKSMFSSFSGFGGSMLQQQFGNMQQSNPVTIMSYFIMGLGALLLIAGVVLTVILKKKSKE